VHKLSSTLIKSGQFTEAGFVLKVHADMLSWSRTSLPPMNDDEQGTTVQLFPRQPESDRKEALYTKIIELFDQVGLLWSIVGLLWVYCGSIAGLVLGQLKIACW
jgi:hypothetical protein